jgi:NAD(P)-dependent dehydrogenase (short-subunit alcohol dehydrogenase family)
MTTETTDVPRSVAITGAGSGLGREIAIGFADKGYHVFGTARSRRKSRMCDRRRMASRT